MKCVTWTRVLGSEEIIEMRILESMAGVRRRTYLLGLLIKELVYAIGNEQNPEDLATELHLAAVRRHTNHGPQHTLVLLVTEQTAELLQAHVPGIEIM